MKEYPKYKQINSKFCDKIPESWHRLRVKNIVNSNIYYPVGDGDHGSIKPEMYEEEGIPYIRVQNLTWDGKITYEGMVFINEDVQLKNRKSILYPGDILIAKTGATVGKIGLVTDEIVEANTTSSVGKITIDKERFDPKYILYCFQTRNFQDQIWLEASQKSAQPGFNIDDLVVFEIVAPSKPEQILIVGFLDYHIGIIDQLISQKEKLINLLKEKRKAKISESVTSGIYPGTKMKDSGIDWLGYLPEEWEVVSLRYLNKKIGSGVTPKGGAEVYVDEGIPFIRSQNVHFDGLRLDDIVKIDLKTHEKMSGTKIQFNDVLLNITGASIGRSCVVKIDAEMNVNQHVCIIRTKEHLNPEFLNLVLQSNIGQTQISLQITGGNREGLTFEAIKDFIIPVPDISTQRNIVSLINEFIYKEIEITNIINNQITKLKEYRQSLISEAVTGKIDVRGWQPNQSYSS